MKLRKFLCLCIALVSMMDSSAQEKHFPGLVVGNEKRLSNVKVEIDLDYRPYQIKLRPQPRPWFSTGLYAVPNEPITIDVPAEIAESIEVRIGVHSDNIKRLEKLGKKIKRDYVVSKVFKVVAGKNVLESPYGGHILIQTKAPIDKEVEFKIDGAVKSPDFILGEMTDKEWKKEINGSKVPWAELRGERIILTLPTAELKTLNNPTELIEFWDHFIVESYDGWWGVTPDNRDNMLKAGTLPWRVITDIQPSAGAAHSGYPIVCMLYWGKRMINIDGMKKSEWGAYHELGHNYQQPWSWKSLGEVSCNFNAFHVLYHLGVKHTRMEKTEWIENALAYAKKKDNTKDFNKINVFEKIIPFLQLVQQSDWSLYTHLTTTVYKKKLILKTDQEKIDYFVSESSRYLKKDLTPFFDAWGIRYSENLKGELSSLKKVDASYWEEFDSNYGVK